MDATALSPAILIVDDDRATLRMLAYAMQKAAPAYPIMTAEDGGHALTHLAARPISLLITDYLLPDMDGLQLIAAVKHVSPATYVVLASADDSPAFRQRAQEQAVDRFCSKLELLAQLKEIVRTALPADIA